MNTTQIDSISGLTAGLVTTLITHPLDLIKVRLQIAGPQKHPFQHVLNNITQQLQLRNHTLISELYKGLSPNILGNVTGWSLYFTLYEQLKTNFANSSNTLKFFSASTISGLFTSLLTNPIWVLKTRLLSEGGRDETLFSATRSIYKNEGIKTFWRGAVPSLFQVFQNSLHFTIYDHLKALSILQPYKKDYDIQFYFMASSVSKFTSMLIMYPFQVLRSNLQKFDSSSMVDEIRNLYMSNGFYRGFTVSVLKVVPATSITFVTYETMKRWLTN